jgi:hypothetical protein
LDLATSVTAVRFQGNVSVEGTTGLTGAVTANSASNDITGIDVKKISGDATAADNAEAFFDGTGYAGTNNVIPTVTTLTGHTPQTGDSYPIVSSGVHGNAAIKGYVDDIGIAGAGLSSIPWNSAWDAEVQSEVEDALTAYGASTLNAASVRSAVGLASANLDTQLGTIDDFLDTEIAAIKAKTDNLPSDPADASDIAAAFSAVTAALAALLTTAQTESYRGTNATGSVVQLLYEILQNVTEFSISGTTKTVKKLDGSTTAKTYTLNQSPEPTAITETT